MDYTNFLLLFLLRLSKKCDFFVDTKTSLQELLSSQEKFSFFNKECLRSLFRFSLKNSNGFNPLNEGAVVIQESISTGEFLCKVDLAANSLSNKSAKAILCLGERIHHKVAKEFLKPRNKSQQLHGISLNFGSPTHAKATVISLSDYLNSPLHLVLQDNVARKQPTSVSSGLQLTTEEAIINN